MSRAMLSAVILIATSALLAACGSSSSSTQSKNANAGGTQSASSGRSYGSGAYGSSGTPASSSTSSGSGRATEITTKHSKFGMILAGGPKQLTVYLFQGDKGASAGCTGACAVAWPPVRTSGTAVAGGQAANAHLGTITRPGGIKQVTYNGHPLYYFARDKDSGDAYGQAVKAFGAAWYVLAPSGQKVDNS